MKTSKLLWLAPALCFAAISCGGDSQSPSAVGSGGGGAGTKATGGTNGQAGGGGGAGATGVGLSGGAASGGGTGTAGTNGGGLGTGGMNTASGGANGGGAAAGRNGGGATGGANGGAAGGGNGERSGGAGGLAAGGVGTGGAAAAAGSGAIGGALAPGIVGATVANFMMAKWPNLDATAADCTGPANCFSMNFTSAPAGAAPKFWEYTYGVPLYGVQKLYEKTGQAKYLQFVKKYVDRYVDGTGEINYGRAWPATNPPTVIDPTVQDVIQPSVLLFGVYKATQDPRYLKAMTATRNVFKVIPKNSAGAFWHKPTYPNQQWLDAVYMSLPFIAKYGALHADQVAPGDGADCFSTATVQIKLVAERTFNAQKQSYFHAWNGAADGKWLGLPLPAKTPPLDGTVVSPVLWSRSIAWLIAGVVDVLDDLPPAHADRAALVAIVNNVAAGLKRYQDPATGLWYQVIDVMSGPLPANGGYPGESVTPAPNWLETSASAIFAYALAKAVKQGTLPAEYLTVAKNAWTGVKGKIDLGANGAVNIRGTVVGMSVGATFNAYTNADFRSDLSGNLPEPAPGASCPATGRLGRSAPFACKYIYVRDNVPQGFGAVLLAASELEF